VPVSAVLDQSAHKESLLFRFHPGQEILAYGHRRRIGVKQNRIANSLRYVHIRRRRSQIIAYLVDQLFDRRVRVGLKLICALQAEFFQSGREKFIQVVPHYNQHVVHGSLFVLVNQVFGSHIIGQTPGRAFHNVGEIRLVEHLLFHVKIADDIESGVYTEHLVQFLLGLVYFAEVSVGLNAEQIVV